MSTSSMVSPLRNMSNIYRFDAVFSAAFGIVLISFASPLLALFNSQLPPSLLVIFGIVLLPWAAFNYWSSLRPAMGRAAFGLHMATDWGCIAALTIMLIAEFAHLSLEGRVMLAGSALSVFSVVSLKLATTIID